MPMILYSTNTPSPAARAVEIVVKILKLDVEILYLDMMNYELHKPWFKKINPAKQVPVFDDNGFILTESLAIIVYLFNAYAPKDVLEQYYPTDLKQRAIIDSRLHFQSESLFAREKAVLRPLLLTSVNEPVPLKITKYLIEAVECLEIILEGRKWLACDRLTMADISTVATIDLVELVVPLNRYKNITAWAEMARMVCPFYDEVSTERLKILSLHVKATCYDAEDRWNQIHRNKYQDMD